MGRRIYTTEELQIRGNEVMADIIEKAVAEGAVASGGIGGVTSPAAGILDNLTDPGDFTNTLVSTAGILPPDSSRRFLEYIWNQQVLSQDGRKVFMRANTMELDKMRVGERAIRAANQGDNTYVNADVQFTKIELRTKKIRLDWEVTTEALEDNIEGAALEDHLVRAMTFQYANDIEDLAINGLGTGVDPFLSIMEGFVKKVKEDGSTEATVNATAGWTLEHLQTLVSAVPRKYRATQNGMKFYAATNVVQSLINGLGHTGNLALVPNVVERIITNGPPVLGGPNQYRLFGLPLVEVPLYPDGFIDLTFPANRIWGFQRDVVMHREFQPKKDSIEYTMFVRFGLELEEPLAGSWADSAAD